MYGINDQAAPAKDVVVEKDKTEIDDRKSEKKVPVKATTESTESMKTSKPHVFKENLVVESQNVAVETEFRLHDEKFVKDLSRITMMTKSQFKNSGHSKRVDIIYQKDPCYLIWDVCQAYLSI